MIKKHKDIWLQLKNRKVLYGVTDRRYDPFFWQINDFLIDHSPISSKEKSMFFNALYLLVASGVRLTKALEILAERQKNPRFKRILDTMLHDITENGISFSQSLEKYPFLFKKSEIKILYAGEISGRLEQNLASVSKQVSKNIEIQIRVRTALMYPITVFCALFFAAMIILVVVVPRFKSLFSEFPNSELPIATRVLIGSSEFLKNFWWFVITLMIAAFFMFQNWRKSEKGRLKWDAWTFNLPYFGSLIRNIQTVTIASNFASLMEAGIPVLKTIQVLEEIVSNSVTAKALQDVRLKIMAGARVHEAFRENKAFDPSLAEVIEIGEKTGKIPEILERTAVQYELEVDAQLKNINTIIEPLVLVVMGSAVAFMAFAILTPVLKLQQLFSTMH